MSAERGESNQLFFLVLMGLLTLAAAGWTGYTYNQIGMYRVARQRAIDRYPELQKIGLEIQRYQASGGKRVNIRTHLKHAARGVGIEPEPIDQRSTPVGEYREHGFDVRMKGVPRHQVLRFIYRVRQVIPRLRTKEIQMVGTVRSAPPEDRWDWKVVFAYREKLKD